MKPASEWVLGEPVITSWDKSPANLITMMTNGTNHSAEYLIEFVKLIQLDAYAKGMAAGAKVIVERYPLEVQGKMHEEVQEACKMLEDVSAIEA